MKHKHADLIHAWADGAEIQYRPVPEYGEWKDEPRHLIWDNLAEYRIKPEQDGSLINEGTKTKQKQGEPVGKFAKFTDGIWREVTDGSAGVLLYTHPKEWVGLMRGVRAEGDSVIIKVNGGNDEARFLCEELINEMAIYKEKT